MALPLTRPRTYTPGSPVVSADLNEIFDAIIGAKYKEREESIPGSSFVPFLGVPDGTGFDGVVWTHVASAFTVLAPIVVPVGSRITRVRLGYNRKAAGNVTVSLNKIVAGVESGVATFTDNASGNVYVEHELAGVNHTVLTGESFQLGISFDAASAAAGGKAIDGVFFHDRL